MEAQSTRVQAAIRQALKDQTLLKNVLEAKGDFNRIKELLIEEVDQKLTNDEICEFICCMKYGRIDVTIAELLDYCETYAARKRFRDTTPEWKCPL